MTTNATALSAVIYKVSELAPDVREFTLIPGNDELFPLYSAGSHVVLSLPIGGRIHRNAYSLLGDPARRDHWRIAVRRQQSSRGGSAWLHDEARAGMYIDLSPPVTDLAAQGYPLIGGRLDYLNKRPVAALVYKRHQHVINLFVMPAEGGVVPAKASASLNGYNLRHWRAGALRFWAVSDLNAAELEEFERLVRAQP